ncbi:MAG: hypothetical protein ACXWXS_07295, partial [Actinomycetota bacterium]
MSRVPDEVPPASYAGSRLGTDVGPPQVSAYDGLALPVEVAPELMEPGAEDRELAEAIAGEGAWMTAFLERLVD